MTQTATSDAWYFTLGGQQYGPVSGEDLRQRVTAGQVTPSDLVWQEGMPDWQAVSALPHLFPTAASAPLTYQGPTPLNYSQVAGVRYAGFWWRVLAYLIDYVVTFVAAVIISGIGAIIGAGVGAADEVLIAIDVAASLLGIILGWLYYALMESSSKQASLGKLACGMTVTDLNGNRISFGRATGRYFSKMLSGLTLGIGFLMVAFTERKQGLHDMIASTLVLKR